MVEFPYFEEFLATRADPAATRQRLLKAFGMIEAANPGKNAIDTLLSISTEEAPNATAGKQTA